MVTYGNVKEVAFCLNLSWRLYIFGLTRLSLVGDMPQEVTGEESELDGQDDDDDGGDDVERDGAPAEGGVKVLHGGVRVREAGAGQVVDLGRHLQSPVLPVCMSWQEEVIRALPDSSSPSFRSSFRAQAR